jgi:translation elongation factor EF-Ts
LCETDFVAKNESFMELCDQILDKVMATDGEFYSRDEAPQALVEELDSIVKEAVGSL